MTDKVLCIMTYAFISDLHSNVEAVEAVLSAVPLGTPVYCLGDVVGYGADPNGVCEILRKRDIKTVKGNHDAAAVGEVDFTNWNPLAVQSAVWTKHQLTAENAEWLKALPYSLEVNDQKGGFTVVHASPNEPSQWEYVLNLKKAECAFEHFKTQICFIGHSHYPHSFELRGGKVTDEIRSTKRSENTMKIKSGSQYIINTGSVGQPRDANNKASFVLYDSTNQTIQWRRSIYDIERAAGKILAVDLPRGNAERLSIGR